MLPVISAAAHFDLDEAIKALAGKWSWPGRANEATNQITLFVCHCS
jgi:hypothetical protein